MSREVYGPLADDGENVIDAKINDRAVKVKHEMSREANEQSSVMLLAGDVGGSKTRLGLFERGGDRPKAVAADDFVTLDYDGLDAIIDRFLHGQRVAPD